MNHDPLTYRFPRTLEEAFPNKIVRGYAVTKYTNRNLLLTKWMLRVGLVGIFALFLAHI